MIQIPKSILNVGIHTEHYSARLEGHDWEEYQDSCLWATTVPKLHHSWGYLHW